MLPPLRQTLFFSATMAPEMRRLADKFLSNPKEIEVARQATTAESIAQFAINVPHKLKREALRALLRSEEVKNRPEERRGGKEWVSKCRSRWSQDHRKKKKKKKKNT